MPHLNWLDLTLVLLLIWSVFTGMRSGLARMAIGFIAAVVGLVAGFWCYGQLANELAPWINNPIAANVVAFLAIFLGVVLVGTLLGALISRLLYSIGISWMDRLLGGIAGFLRGALVIAALTDVVMAYTPSPLPTCMQQSKVLPYAAELASALVTVAPKPLRDAFNQQMQNLRRFWAQPPDREQQSFQVAECRS